MRKHILIFFLIPLLAVTCKTQNEIQIKPVKLSDNVYALFGSGGNMGLCIGEDGSFLIDDQFANLTEKIKSAIAELSDHPVKFLVNTHYHGDHTGGNENFASDGAIIIAHENVRQRLSVDQFIASRNRTVEAKPKGAWPILTFTKDIKLHINGEDIMIIHVHKAHTDGDSYVFFPNSNVLHMGDVFFNGRYPYLDIDSGGTIKGFLAAIDVAIMMVDDETTIIPGHGDIAKKSDLLKYKETLTIITDRISKAIEDGMSLEQTVSAGLTKEYDEDWNWSFINNEKIVTAIYKSLSSESAK